MALLNTQIQWHMLGLQSFYTYYIHYFSVALIIAIFLLQKVSYDLAIIITVNNEGSRENYLTHVFAAATTLEREKCYEGCNSIHHNYTRPAV